MAEKFAVDLPTNKFRIFNKVISLDLVALKPHIQVCDISKLPYEDCSVGCVVFCLSLMGTNYWQFIGEALRVLSLNGTLIISEVSSRMTDMDAFIETILRSGCKVLEKDEIEGYFNLMVFEKIHQYKVKNYQGKEGLLKACLYKKR